MSETPLPGEMLDFTGLSQVLEVLDTCFLYLHSLMTVVSSLRLLLEHEAYSFTA